MINYKMKEFQEQFTDFPIGSYSENVTFYISLIEKNKDIYGSLKYDVFDKNKNIYFADGAIGSGKSTIMRNYIIKKEIGNLLYYSPEYYVNYLEHRFNNADFMSQYNKAKKFLWEDMQKQILTGKSFIVESVFTKKEKIDLLKSAIKQGYKLNGIYVGTFSPDINAERIDKRMQEGSYAIPKEKTIDRYNKSLENLKTVFEISDTFMLFDNSCDKPYLKIYKDARHVYIAETLPVWINNYLLADINLEEYTYTAH